MATYKVIQDIEAEDKLLGPLTLKQFGFGAITAICCYITYLFVAKNAWFMSIPLWPVIIVFGFLAFPWGRDQPTEIWLLAKIRFFMKPRRRIWDQEGLEELVTITAPKKVDDTELTKSFDKDEAKSRLKALAETIDSRGWAIQNANLNVYTVPGNVSMSASNDRLMAADTFALPTRNIVDVHATDDVLDETNETAQQLGKMLEESSEARRQQLIEQMKQKTVREEAAKPTAEEQAVLDRIHEEQARPAPKSHLKTIQPATLGKKKPTVAKKSETSKTASKKKPKKFEADEKPVAAAPTPVSNNLAPGSTSSNPAILALADNDDLNVATIAREAKKATSDDSGEVVISLH